MSKEVVAEVIALIELGLIAPEDIVKCLRKANSEPETALAEQPAQQQNPFGDDVERYARKIREEREAYKAIFTASTPQPAQQALDKKAENARELVLDYEPSQTDWEAVAADQAMTIALLKADQPAQQEPFGYFKAEPFGWTDCAETDEGAVALYERPAQRTWVGLTDEQIDRLWSQSLADTEGETWLPLREFARAIEAAHGITGEQK